MKQTFLVSGKLVRFLMIVFICCAGVSIYAQFGGGIGTEDNPFVISRAVHLHNIRGDFLSAHFIQTTNIDISPEALQDEDWYDQEGGWLPIDWSVNDENVQTVLPFRGLYDGNGFEIRGLTTNRPAYSSQTLFFRTIGATVKNVRMVDVNVRAYRNNGGIIGNLEEGSLLLNSSSTGSVLSPQNQWIHGGLVGYALNSTIRNSYSNATVNSGGGRTGGLLGWSNGSTIINSYATGPILPATAQVCGGLIGLIQRWGTGVGVTTMTHCYATGRVSGAGQMGGLVGVAQGQTITASYWDTETTGMLASPGGGIGRTTAEMTHPYGGEPRTYADWDFDEIWVHDEAFAVNDGYPYLFFEGEEGEFGGGDGSENNPWLIVTATHLDNIRNYLGEEHGDKFFTQRMNIDLGVAPYNEGWEPIGTTPENSFRGKYNGNGFLITNLTIRGGEHTGLFGYMVNGTLENIGLEDVDVTGIGSYSSSLLGRTSNGRIRNCYATGNVSSTNVNTGGFIGAIEEGTQVTDCWSNIIFRSSAGQSGGFIGLIDRSTVRNCFTKGSVTITGEESLYIGGFTSVSFMGTIINSYSRSTVTTPNDAVMVGSFIGYNMGEITNCYTTGRVTSGIQDVGGLIGMNEGEVANSYWDREATGMNNSDGGIGRTTEQMTYPYAADTYLNWDFDEVWASDGGGDINNGYPILHYQFESFFAGGFGTEEEPWQVETAEHLSGIRNYLGEQNSNKYFIQTADIDLGVAPWNIEPGWLPIGNNDNRFTADYNGNSFAITNLTIVRDLPHQGLFGYVDGASLTNIALTDVNITGGSHIGGLAGQAVETNINNCSVQGNITGTTNIGGIAGHIGNNSEIRGTYTAGIVIGSNPETRIGGIAGQNAGTNIIDCYSAMKVTGQQSFIGGLVGFNQSGSINRSYAVGFVSARDLVDDIGGLVGAVQQIEVTNSFWNIFSTGQEASPGGGTGLSTPAMVFRDTYTEAGWNFETVWSITNNQSFPFLARQETPALHNIPGPYNLQADVDEDDNEVDLTWQMIGAPQRYNIYRNNTIIAAVNHPLNEYNDQTPPQNVDLVYYVTAIYVDGEDADETAQSNYAYANLTPGFAGGNGTEENPFQVNSASTFDNIRYFLDAHYIQTADINLGVAPWNEGEGWVPIGTSIESFAGSYNGDGHLISNLTMARAAGNQGLFGYTRGAVLDNIHLRDVSINSKAQTGALAGVIDVNSLVKNCSSTGQLTIQANTDRHIGGLVGWNYNSLVTDSYSHVNINGGERAGGLVGWLNGGHARNSYATGNLTINGVSGGLVGLIQTWGQGQGVGTITNCYARGSVTGNTQIGGLVGTITMAGDIITHSYATGRVTGTGGGLVGQSNAGNVVVNSFWDVETTGKEASAGGGLGRLTRQMVYPNDLNETYVRWDFEDIWRLDSTFVPEQNPGINDGYPYLHFQAVAPRVLDTPEVVIEIQVIENQTYAGLSWEGIEDASSYRIYASLDPYSENWGNPIAIIAETEFRELIGENQQKYYRVVASVNEAP